MPTNSAPKFKYNDLRQRLRAGMDTMVSPGQAVATEVPVATVVDPSSAKAFTDPTGLGARMAALPGDAPAAAATVVANAPSNRDIANQVYANRRAFEENAVRGGIGGTSDAIRTTGANSDYSKRVAAGDQAARDRTAAFNVARANQNEGINPFASHMLAQSQLSPNGNTGHALNDMFMAMTMPADSFSALKNSQAEMAKTGLLVSPEYHRQAMQRAIAGNPNLPPEALGQLMSPGVTSVGDVSGAHVNPAFISDPAEREAAQAAAAALAGQSTPALENRLQGIYNSTTLAPKGIFGTWTPNIMATNDEETFRRFSSAAQAAGIPEKKAREWWSAKYGDVTPAPSTTARPSRGSMGIGGI